MSLFLQIQSEKTRVNVHFIDTLMANLTKEAQSLLHRRRPLASECTDKASGKSSHNGPSAG